MYKINCDKKILHDIRDENLQVINPSLSLKLNSFGELNFSILDSHENKECIKKLVSNIEVFDDNNLIFAGRSLTDEKDFYKTGQVYCEGELAFLVDTIIRPYEIHDLTVKEYLKFLINSHNNQVEDKKKFVLGIVDVIDPAGDGLLYRKNESYVSTWNEIKEKLINRLGGYLRIRHDGNTKYLDYVQQYGKKSTQTIVFGENILDLTQFTSAENIATIVIPLGAKNDETGEYLTIKSINNGKDYIEDEAGISLWGRIVKTIEYDDITLPINLFAKAKEYLKNSINLALTIELTAIDLGLLNVDIEKIRLGDSIRVISKFHNLDSWFIVNELEIDLENPQNNKITLGKTLSTLTEEQLNSVKDIINSTEKIEENLNKVKIELNETKDGLELKISKDELEAEITANADSWGLSFNGKLVSTHYKFDSDGFQIGSNASGDTAIHTQSYSMWKHSKDGYTKADADGFYRNGRPYHTLMAIGSAIVGGSAGVYPSTAIIQLPDEWKGKQFEVQVQMIDTAGGVENEVVKRTYLRVTNINTTNATFSVKGYWTAINNGVENEKELNFSYIAIGG